MISDKRLFFITLESRGLTHKVIEKLWGMAENYFRGGGKGLFYAYLTAWGYGEEEIKRFWVTALEYIKKEETKMSKKENFYRKLLRWGVSIEEIEELWSLAMEYIKGGDKSGK